MIKFLLWRIPSGWCKEMWLQSDMDENGTTDHLGCRCGNSSKSYWWPELGEWERGPREESRRDELEMGGSWSGGIRITPKSRMTCGRWRYFHQGEAAGLGERRGVLKSKDLSDGVWPSSKYIWATGWQPQIINENKTQMGSVTGPGIKVLQKPKLIRPGFTSSFAYLFLFYVFLFVYFLIYTLLLFHVFIF